MKERLEVRVVLCAEGAWTRIRGPLSGCWYGPWRFTRRARPSEDGG